MDKVMELKQVTYTYPLAKQASITDLEFVVERGTFYGIIGENGAGKTTLCSILRGFIPDFYKGELLGEVYLEGKRIDTYSAGELALKIGYVFQNPFNQISGVKDTVFEEIAYGLENFGVDINQINSRVTSVMELTQITHLADKNPFELSGGQQQRVALASTMVLEPDILIIDEPTSQLDPEGTENVFKIIAMLKEEKKTIILVEHKVDMIAKYADQVLVMKNGRLVKTGKTQEVLSDISLIQYGVKIPQVALMGNQLAEAGIALDYIPITEEQAVKVFGKILRKEGESDGIY